MSKLLSTHKLSPRSRPPAAPTLWWILGPRLACLPQILPVEKLSQRRLKELVADLTGYHPAESVYRVPRSPTPPTGTRVPFTSDSNPLVCSLPFLSRWVQKNKHFRLSGCLQTAGPRTQTGPHGEFRRTQSKNLKWAHFVFPIFFLIKFFF